METGGDPLASDPSTPLQSNLTQIGFTYIHPRNPLYLHPSDTPGSILISQQLTGIENYTGWSHSMRVALLAKNKIAFVDGTCRREQYKGDLEHEWERCNAFVLSWITNSVSKELANGLMFSSNAHNVWMDLKERFDKRNLTRIYQLHREICTMSQGTLSVSEYYSKLRNLWDEHISLVPLPSCECDKYMEYADHMEKQKFIQFLMGLNETFAQSRSHILMIVPSPNLNQAYNMIMQDESQRVQSHMISALVSPLQQLDMNDPTALSSMHHNKFKKPNDLYCEHCHMRNHTTKYCYKLIGYPSDHKYGKKNIDKTERMPQSGDERQRFGGDRPQRYGGNKRNQAHNAHYTYGFEVGGNRHQGQISRQVEDLETGNCSSASMVVPSFTPDQYKHIMKILDNDTTPQENATANMAGIPPNSTTCFNSRCFSAGLTKPSWVIDTGATNHMIYSMKSLLQSSPALSHSNQVFLPNGQTTEVTHIGSVSLFNNCVLHNVLLVPHFEYNLLSISKLTKELHCCVSFYPSFCLFQDLYIGEVMGIGKEK